jgi:hypothetical protein
MHSTGHITTDTLRTAPALRVAFPEPLAGPVILRFTGPDGRALAHPQITEIDATGFTLDCAAWRHRQWTTQGAITWIATEDAPGASAQDYAFRSTQGAHEPVGPAVCEDDLDAAFFAAIQMAGGATAPDPAHLDPLAPLPPAAHDDSGIGDWLTDYVLMHAEELGAEALECDAEVGNGVGGTPCYAPGTMITTLRGQVDVARLVTGDLVLTRDHGFQPLRALAQTHLTSDRLAADPDLAPVVIHRDALGPGRPAADLHVSPHHRLMLTGLHAELLAGQEEVFVTAMSLVDDHHVRRSTARQVTYVLPLFDRPEVIYAHGTAAESLSVETVQRRDIAPASQEELSRLFPDLLPAPQARHAM